MNINFVKMHALGNDFMVIDGVNQSISQFLPILSKNMRQLGNRHRGVGFDQCLLIEPAISADTDFFYRIFNADGSEVGQCGNGARCAARFIHEQQLSQHKILKLGTKTTKLTVEIHDENYHHITAELGIPRFLSLEVLSFQDTTFHAVDLGNPHAVIQVNNILSAPVEMLGQQFNDSENNVLLAQLFPYGVNVGFMQLVNNEYIKLRVFERGAGETQACGSGACAAMVCAKQFYGASSKVKVELTGGMLMIEWQGQDKTVRVTGNAERVFDGVVRM